MKPKAYNINGINTAKQAPREERASRVLPRGKPRGIKPSVGSSARKYESNLSYFSRSTSPIKHNAPLLFFVFAILFLPFVLFAADFTSSEPLDIELSNSSPAPFEYVRATAKSFRFDLNKSKVSWSVNGRVFRSGIGVKYIEFNVGESGSVTNIGVIVETPSGSISQTISVRPAGVDILWQADTYTPPLYKGKSRATSAANIRVVAIPNIVNVNGRKVSSDEIVYKWKIDGRARQEESGYGKNFIDVVGARIYGGTEVIVEISTTDGDIKAKNFLEIPAENPQLIFYEKAPLEGVKYENALIDSVVLTNQEIEIRAEPYFVSDMNALEHTWTLNRKEFETSGAAWNSVVLRSPESVSGRSRLELFINGLSGIRGRVLQSANAILSISFNESGILDNLFGL